MAASLNRAARRFSADYSAPPSTRGGTSLSELTPFLFGDPGASWWGIGD
jgi:hypothetical protein